MRKILLLTALLLTAGLGMQAATGDWQKKALPSRTKSEVPTRADDDANDNSLIFTYCQGYDGGVGNQASLLQAAMSIPEETAKKWAGAEITKLQIGIGTGRQSSITVFITNNLLGKPLYSQEFKLETKEGWNTVTLDSPFKITGEELFIGYQYKNCAQGEYPIGIDGILSTSQLGDYVAVGNTWDHLGEMFGNVCIKAILSGDMLPTYSANIVDLRVDDIVKPGDQFNAEVDFINIGKVDISSLNIECKVGESVIENPVFTTSPATVLKGTPGTIKISGLSSATIGANVPVEVTITEINGMLSQNEINNSATGYITCFNEGFKRNVVVEEWTGTWCGYCPRGIVGMGYMEENYGNDGFIGIAVHSDDRMETSSYIPFLNKWALVSFPGSIVNRKYVTDPNMVDLENYYKRIVKEPAYGTVETLTANYDSEADNLMVNASVKWAVPVVEGNYSLAFVITEDGVGPYVQTNYFAGQSVSMGGWEKMSLNQLTTFNDVARDIKDSFGIEGSLPANMDTDKEYRFSTTMPLNNVRRLNHCKLIAMILNGDNYEIVNAASISLYETGVESSVADSVEITAQNGTIRVNGEYSAFDVYSTDGKKAANPVNGVATVSPGIYVVKVTDLNGNAITRKVAVNR